jgi:nucleotide-binding universal stress UspA family protein
MSTIIVGVDGSEGSKHALEWAAAEAKLRHARLTLVYAWYPPAALYGGMGMGWTGIDSELIPELRTLAQQRLDQTCAELSASLEGLEVERRVVEGTAALELIDAADGADLLVVGTRGHGGFTGLLLGSVSQQCAHHSPCPVVIVPPAEHQTR